MVILYTSHFCDEKKTYMSNEADARAHCVIGIALFLPQSQVRYQTNPGHGRHGHGADAAAVSPFLPSSLPSFLSLLRADCRVYIVWLASSFVRAENARHALPPSRLPVSTPKPKHHPSVRPSAHTRSTRLDSVGRSIYLHSWLRNRRSASRGTGRKGRNNNFL